MGIRLILPTAKLPKCATAALLVLLSVCSLPAISSAGEYSHGPANTSSSWNDSNAWTPLNGAPVGVPGTADTAYVYRSLTVGSSAEVGTLYLDTYISYGPAYNIIMSDGMLTIHNGGQWQWGGFNDDDDANFGAVSSYGTMVLVDDIADHYGNGAGTVDIIAHEISHGMTWNNYGTMRHDSLGTFVLGSSACQYANYGTHDFTNDGDIVTSGHGGERTTNYGTIVKSGGAGASSINGELSNQGTVESQTGTIVVGNSLDYTSSATHELLGGTWVAQNGASIVIASRGELYTIEASAHVVLNGSNANFYTTQTSTYTPIEDSLTTVKGTLEIHGNRTFTNTLSSTGAIVVADDAILTANVSNSGTFDVGNSPGVGRVNGDFSQDADGTLNIELGGLVAGDEYDVLEVTGTATLAGTLNVSYWDGFTADVGDSFTILDAGALSGTFDQVISPDTGVWAVDYDTANGDVILTLTAVPEPATLGLLAVGGVGLVLRRRRK